MNLRVKEHQRHSVAVYADKRLDSPGIPNNSCLQLKHDLTTCKAEINKGPPQSPIPNCCNWHIKQGGLERPQDQDDWTTVISKVTQEKTRAREGVASPSSFEKRNTIDKCLMNLMKRRGQREGEKEQC